MFSFWSSILLTTWLAMLSGQSVTERWINSLLPNTPDGTQLIIGICPFSSIGTFPDGLNGNETVTIIESLPSSIGCLRRLDEVPSSLYLGFFMCSSDGTTDTLSNICNPDKWRMVIDGGSISNEITAKNIQGPIVAANFTLKISHHAKDQIIPIRVYVNTSSPGFLPFFGVPGYSYMISYSNYLDPQFQLKYCTPGSYIKSITTFSQWSAYDRRYWHGFKFTCTDNQVHVLSGNGRSSYPGAEVTTTDCSVLGRQPVNGIYFDLTANTAPRCFRVTCANYSSTNWISSANEEEQKSYICPSGHLAHGAAAYSGNWVTAFALQCVQVPFSFATKPINVTLQDPSNPFFYPNIDQFSVSIGYGSTNGVIISVNSSMLLSEIKVTTTKWAYSPWISMANIKDGLVRFRIIDFEAFRNDTKTSIAVKVKSPLEHQILDGVSLNVYLTILEKIPAIQTSLSIQSSNPDVNTQSTALPLIIISVSSGIIVICGGLGFVTYFKHSRKIQKLSQAMDTNIKQASVLRQSIPINKSQSMMTSRSMDTAFRQTNLTNSISIKKEANEFVTQTLSLTGGSNFSELSIPGYLLLNIQTDLIISNEMVGEGASGSVYSALIINPILIQKHGVSRATIKYMSDSSSDVFKFEVALLGSMPKSPYLVEFMGYIEGPCNGIVMKQYSMSLKALIYSSNYSDVYAKKIALECAMGIEHIHIFGIVHFDIKPSNFLVDLDDQGQLLKCVLSDFGCAKPVGSDMSFNNDRLVKGLTIPRLAGITMQYGSPEQIMNYFQNDTTCTESHKKSDIYCYAMSIFEMLQRKRPWGDLTADEIQEKVLGAERPVPSQELEQKILANSNNDRLKQVFEIVKKCWAAYPSDRPSATDIVVELSKL